jgi:hypothetical protein
VARVVVRCWGPYKVVASSSSFQVASAKDTGHGRKFHEDEIEGSRRRGWVRRSIARRRSSPYRLVALLGVADCAKRTYFAVDYCLPGYFKQAHFQLMRP